MISKSRSTLAVSAAIIALTVGVSASSMAASYKEKHVRGKSAIQLDKHGKASKFKYGLREIKANEVNLSAIETSTATTDDAVETSTATTDDVVETSTATTDDAVETSTATTDDSVVATAPQPTIAPFPGGSEGDEGDQISPSTPSSTSPSPQSGRDNESD